MMNTPSGASRTALRGTTLTIVMTRESVVNTMLMTYVLMTPLFIIPVAGMLGTSDLLFIPAVALGLLVGTLKKCSTSHYLLAALLMLVGVSLHQTEDFQYVVKWIRLIGITFPFFLAAFSTISLQQVVRAFFWSGLLSILVGIALWWFDVILFVDEANQRIYTDSGESRVRAAGIFGNSGAFGALIAMWTVTCGMLTITEKRPNKLMLATVLLTAIVGLAGSTSRTSLLAIVVGFATGASFMLAAHLRRRGFRLSVGSVSLLLFLILTIGVTLCFVIPHLMGQEWLGVTLSRFDPRVHESSNNFLSGRVAIWQEYLRSMDQWGIFGVGYKQGHVHFSTSPHNQFLALAAECGLLSLCVFILFVLSVFTHAFLHRRDQPFESMMCIAVMSAFIADGVGGSPLGSWQVTPITMILLGICIRRFTRQESADRNRPIVESSRV